MLKGLAGCGAYFHIQQHWPMRHALPIVNTEGGLAFEPTNKYDIHDKRLLMTEQTCSHTLPIILESAGDWREEHSEHS